MAAGQYHYHLICVDITINTVVREKCFISHKKNIVIYLLCGIVDC